MKYYIRDSEEPAVKNKFLICEKVNICYLQAFPIRKSVMNSDITELCIYESINLWLLYLLGITIQKSLLTFLQKKNVFVCNKDIQDMFYRWLS